MNFFFSAHPNVHSDLPLETKGQLVPEADEARYPTTTRDTELLVHSDRSGGVRDGPKPPNRSKDQIHGLDACGEGRP